MKTCKENFKTLCIWACFFYYFFMLIYSSFIFLKIFINLSFLMTTLEKKKKKFPRAATYYVSNILNYLFCCPLNLSMFVKFRCKVFWTLKLYI